MTTGGFSSTRLGRVRALLERHVHAGFVPGVVAVLARHGEVHIEAVGTLAFEGAGSRSPMAPDTICRIASMTKPIVAACAMTLVEDGTLRLDDPVDDLLPELAEMTVLADPHGPLHDTVPATRPITLRDLLAFTLGTGMVPAEPGTVPIADALATHGAPSPDEWLRRLGALPLVHQPGERWMYETGANVTGVLIARATGGSLGAAVRERICAPLGMQDTAFSVDGARRGRVATAYAHDPAAAWRPMPQAQRVADGDGRPLAPGPGDHVLAARRQGHRQAGRAGHRLPDVAAAGARVSRRWPGRPRSRSRATAAAAGRPRAPAA